MKGSEITSVIINRWYWKEICLGDKADKVKVHRFDRVWGNKVKIEIEINSTRGTSVYC